MSLPHPFGEYLFAGKCKSFGGSGVVVPGQANTVDALQEWSRWVHGILPSTGCIGIAYWYNIYGSETDVRRALIQSIENIAWQRLNGVQMHAAPQSLWDDPGVVQVYDVNGTPVALTETWIARRVICDLFWRYGARAPTETELLSHVGALAMNPLSVAAAAASIRRQFETSPNPSPSTRPQFRQAVVGVFPAYYLGAGF